MTTLAILIVAGFITLWLWTSAEEKKPIRIDMTAHVAAKVRGDEAREAMAKAAHPASGSLDVFICDVRCGDCFQTFYSFPHNGQDYGAVIVAEQLNVASALDFHRRLEHGVAA